MVKQAKKKRQEEIAEKLDNAREIASILKGQESGDGGAKANVAATKSLKINEPPVNDREAKLCSILGTLDTKDFKSFSSNKKSRS